jgi:nucleotide-binding universal stress UspA family protein
MTQLVRYIWVGVGTRRPPWTRPAAWARPTPASPCCTSRRRRSPDSARGAFTGRLGRGGGDPAAGLEEEEEAAAAHLLQATVARLGWGCDQLELHGRTERVVVAASAQADLLIVARDGYRARLGPKSLGRATRFVADHAACPVLLVWLGTAPGIASIPRRHNTLIRLVTEAESGSILIKFNIPNETPGGGDGRIPDRR